LDYPRGARASQAGGLEGWAIGEELTQQLREMSRREGVTLFMVLLAGWQSLLSRYSGQNDIVVGSPIANRNRVETEKLIGFFVNTLALRTDLSGRPSFRELLRRVREVALGAYAHQDVPFEKLVEELQPERNTGRSPMFQVTFSLQNAPDADLELPGLKLASIGGSLDTAKFEMVLAGSEQAGRIRGGLSYGSDLFSGERIRRMLIHLENLLREMVAEPERPAACRPGRSCGRPGGTAATTCWPSRSRGRRRAAGPSRRPSPWRCI